MIVPKRLYIKNFLSFEEQELSFDEGVTTCIMGKNLTDDGQESNGSGKSAFQSAVGLSITGNISRKITKPKMVRRGEKEAVVMLELYDNFQKESISISRTIPVKGSEQLKITTAKDDSSAKQVEFATVNDGNRWIEDRIGISREDILNYFIVDEINYKSFFNTPDSKKKELISRFSNADIVDRVFDKADSLLYFSAAKIAEFNQHISDEQSGIATLEDLVEKEKSFDFEQDKRDRISKIEANIASIEERIRERMSKINAAGDSISEIRDNIIEEKKRLLSSLKRELEKTVSSVDYSEKIDEIHADMDKISRMIKKGEDGESELNSDLRAAKSDIDKMRLVLKGGVECPNCHHVFNPNSDIPIEEARKKASVFEQEVAEIESSIESVKGIIAKYRSKKSEQESELKVFISKMKENSLNVSKIEDQIASTEREIARGENDVKRKLADVEAERDMISDDRDRISSYESQIEEVKKEQPDTSRINNLRKLVKERENKIKGVEKDLEIERETYDNHSIWKQRFLQFKSYLANKKLRVIQDRINMRLGEMKCDYKLRLEGYKVLGSGEIREKITPYIYKDGEVCDYGEFSKGERARIDFATMITLQTLINDTCENGGLDLLMCDEVMEGLDAQGLNSVLNSFNSMKKTSFVTTHVVNDSLYEHTKMVVKINGKSKIQESWEKN